MSYFFESTLDIPQKKKILLKRMLMGLTSYYPIDRSSITNMPEIIEDLRMDIKKLNAELDYQHEYRRLKYSSLE